MRIVRDIAGYSMGRSDLVRRAMAKKKHDVMLKERENFVGGLVVDGGGAGFQALYGTACPQKSRIKFLMKWSILRLTRLTNRMRPAMLLLLIVRHI